MERIRVFGDRRFRLVGQITYEPGGADEVSAQDAALRGVGIRVYEGVNSSDERCQGTALLCDKHWRDASATHGPIVRGRDFFWKSAPKSQNPRPLVASFGNGNERSPRLRAGGQK